MDHHDELDFDDPALKDAVRRAWAGEASPQRLRGRVSHLIATAGSIDEAAAPRSLSRVSAQAWRSRVYALAAAAIILFAIGLLVLQYQGVFERSTTGRQLAMPTPSFAAPVPAVAQSLVERHDACASMGDHHLVRNPGVKSYGALNVQLTADLGFPVLARGIGSEWRFRGAGACEVGAQRASHLLFARGNQTISLFSLPTGCQGGAPSGALFEGMVSNHAVAGFARNGGVYAVVGSATAGSTAADDDGAATSLQAVTGIRDTLLALFEPGGCTDDTTGDEIFE